MTLCDTLQGMADNGGGWTANVRSAAVLEREAVMGALVDSGVCRSEYSAGMVTTYVARDVGLDVVKSSGKFTKRARAALDEHIAQYADGNAEVGSHQFNRFRSMLANIVGSSDMGSWSRSYVVLNSVDAMQLGGVWSLNNGCWFKDMAHSWSAVNAAGGWLIMGLWASKGQTMVDTGGNSLRVSPGRTTRWGRFQFYEELVFGGTWAMRHATRIIAVPLKDGGVWCFNFYRRKVMGAWDAGVALREQYGDINLHGGDVMRRDLRDLPCGQQLRSFGVSGSSYRTYINGDSFVVQGYGDNLQYVEGDNLQGIAECCGQRRVGYLPRDLLTLDYNARVSRDGEYLVVDRNAPYYHQDEDEDDEDGGDD